MKIIVSRVIDGDSFDAQVKILSKEEERFQYASLLLRFRIGNVNAPEKGQAHFFESKTFLKELIEGKELEVEILEKDRFNRYLVIPYMNEMRLDEYLILRGMVWHFEKRSNHANLIELEQQAICEKTGIWNPKVVESHFSRYFRTNKELKVIS